MTIKEETRCSNLIILPTDLTLRGEPIYSYIITNTRAKGKHFID